MTEQWYREMVGGEHPVVMCHPSMMAAADLIAKELGNGCRTYVSSKMDAASHVVLVDPFRKLDPAVIEYVKARYGPNDDEWNPEDSF